MDYNTAYIHISTHVGTPNGVGQKLNSTGRN